MTDRVAVIFGSASGIGLACARLMAERGAAVVLADIAIEAAGDRADEIVAAGGTAVAMACDVGVEEQVEAAITSAEKRFGRVDVVHNNAAAMHLVGADGPVADAEAAHWDQMMAVNLRGQMFGCKHAVRAMLRSGGGSIVNTSSATATMGELTCTAYGVSKAGVAQLTRSVATQYGRFGIRCNAVLPGLVRVPRQEMGNTMAGPLREVLGRHHLTPYIGEPSDIAHAVAFLCSDEARFITGHLLNVDGGLNAHQAAYVDLLPFVVSSDPHVTEPVQEAT